MVQQVRFQSTLPRGERRMTVQIFQILAYFNPRSREGSDQNLRWKISAATEISIHAPARGATVFSPDTLPLPEISIHAPARGATSGSTSPYSNCADFNPRSREGSDTVLFFFQQSIVQFQSTLPRGERLEYPSAHSPE